MEDGYNKEERYSKDDCNPISINTEEEDLELDLKEFEKSTIICKVKHGRGKKI